MHDGDLALNRALPRHVHWRHWQGREPNLRADVPVVVEAMCWAVSIQTVTAFLFSADAGRPFWHTALLGPRFIASAFVCGPALVIAVLQLIRRRAADAVQPGVIDLPVLVMAVSRQISLFFVGAELFTDFYAETSHARSVRDLVFGLHGLHGLQAWSWTALALNGVAVLLSVHRTRRAPRPLILACGLALAGVWIERGMGLVVPGFTPTPLGAVLECTPAVRGLLVALGLWAFGVLVFTGLAKASRDRPAAAAGPLAEAALADLAGQPGRGLCPAPVPGRDGLPLGPVSGWSAAWTVAQPACVASGVDAVAGAAARRAAAAVAAAIRGLGRSSQAPSARAGTGFRRQPRMVLPRF